MAKKKDILEELENAPVETAEEAVEEKPVVKSPVKDIFTGVVTCDRLNVRALPDVTARINTTVIKGTELELEVIPGNDEWYQYTGVGFVMANFIKRK